MSTHIIGSCQITGQGMENRQYDFRHWYMSEALQQSIEELTDRLSFNTRDLPADWYNVVVTSDKMYLTDGENRVGEAVTLPYEVVEVCTAEQAKVLNIGLTRASTTSGYQPKDLGPILGFPYEKRDWWTAILQMARQELENA